MTENATNLSLMLLKLCEDILPKTAVGRDERITSAVRQVRKYLEEETAANIKPRKK
jgi:hypothetical protein